MSLPPGFLDELRSRTSIAAVVGRKLTWDQRKSLPAKGDYWACCPFHQEKTSSFHVVDADGFYYCFGCHQKGDAITFLREAENMSFMEAVETLAREAGMEMPARDPGSAAREEKRAGLVEAMEAAVSFFRLNLRAAAGAEARAYVERRGLSAETVERFEIGYAPNARATLFGHLREKGFSEAVLDEAGLIGAADAGRSAYDRFRDRLIFPIRDPRGRCIAFGGRAMAADAQAKYLNSKETPLFSKGRTLYNHRPAREAAGRTGALIAVEGYMDVIALAQAGFENAVAPLGTAITEDQLRLMWRIADEPVIALDGDKAGLRAAMRAIDVALPILEAGKSLRFALLPEGRDPDDLIRAEGPAAMRAVLDRAAPMVDLLWRRETEGRVYDSPERRAALDKTLRETLRRIADPSVRGHYEEAIRERRRALFRPAAGAGAGGGSGGARGGGGWRGAGGGGARAGRGGWRSGARGGWPGASLDPVESTKSSALATPATDADRARESAVLATALNHPGLIAEHDEALWAVEFFCADLDRVRRALLSAWEEAEDTARSGVADLRAGVAARLGEDPAEILARSPNLREVRFAAPDASEEMAREGFAEAFAICRRRVAHAADAAEFEREIGGDGAEAAERRLVTAMRLEEAARAASGVGESGPSEEEIARRDEVYAKIRFRDGDGGGGG